MAYRKTKSGTGVSYTYMGETRTLRDWTILWISRFEGDNNPGNDRIRAAVKVLSKRIIKHGFLLAYETPPRQMQALVASGKVRSTENMANRAKDLQGGVWTWKQKRRSLGEIRQILHDRPQDLFDGAPMCGGALPIRLSMIF